MGISFITDILGVAIIWNLIIYYRGDMRFRSLEDSDFWLLLLFVAAAIFLLKL